MLVHAVERALRFPAASFHRIEVRYAERDHHGGVQVAQVVKAHVGQPSVRDDALETVGDGFAGAQLDIAFPILPRLGLLNQTHNVRRYRMHPGTLECLGRFLGYRFPVYLDNRFLDREELDRCGQKAVYV